MGKAARQIRRDSMGSAPHAAHSHAKNMDSLTYSENESDVFRAHVALDQYHHRGRFWNSGKHETSLRYIYIFLVGVVQGAIAYGTNVVSLYFISFKFESVYKLLENGHTFLAFFWFVLIQTFFALLASGFVWIEPVAAGSGIPEVKCYLVRDRCFDLLLTWTPTYPRSFLVAI